MSLATSSTSTQTGPQDIMVVQEPQSQPQGPKQPSQGPEQEDLPGPQDMAVQEQQSLGPEEDIPAENQDQENLFHVLGVDDIDCGDISDSDAYDSGLESEFGCE